MGITDLSFVGINHFCLNFHSLSFQLVARGGLGYVASMKGRTGHPKAGCEELCLWETQKAA